MNKYYIFDLDGTLVDSLPGIAKALNRALASLGYQQYSEDRIRRMVGKGARWLCRMACNPEYPEQVSDEAAAQLVERFMVEYPMTWKEGTVIYQGIRDLLQTLKLQGAKIAVLSNKPHTITAPLVAELFPTEGFNPVLGHSDRYPRKPNPMALKAIADEWGVPVGEVTLIGDSLHDAHTAQNAGSKLILVSWGYADQAELSSHGAPYVKTVSDLADLLVRE